MFNSFSVAWNACLQSMYTFVKRGWYLASNNLDVTHNEINVHAINWPLFQSSLSEVFDHFPIDDNMVLKYNYFARDLHKAALASSSLFIDNKWKICQASLTWWPKTYTGAIKARKDYFCYIFYFRVIFCYFVTKIASFRYKQFISGLIKISFSDKLGLTARPVATYHFAFWF